MRYWLAAFFVLGFSFWLMWHTFSYDSEKSQILISGKVWSDFGGYLPQIRSFSYGNNWPPQYPLFPGEPTRYHYLFYAFAGSLEKIGLRIDWAINLPSALGFFLLIIMIWKLSFAIFTDRRISFLSILFFLFNGSFSWLDFLKKYSLQDLIHLKNYVSFGPWNGSDISAFWNLNIYTNQRHLGLSFAVCLLIIYILYTGHRKLLYLVGFLTGSFLLLNQAVLAMAVLFVGWFFLMNSHLRKPLVISFIGAIPWFFISNIASSGITFHPGFLLPYPLGLSSILSYWFQNIGFHLILIPLGLILAPRKARILALPLIALFLLPNIFQFSPDMINNHKFFNLFLILGSMFTASIVIKKKLLTLLLILPLTLGGIIDLFPVINDYFITVDDIKVNADARYFSANTPRDAVVLNSTWFYHPASLAGRFIYNGYSYFVWSFGYDQITREEKTKAIYSAENKTTACQLLQKENISYVELSPHPESFLKPNWALWETQFIPAYTNPVTNLTIYNVWQNCQSI